jgi:hypothetical protein
LKYLFHGFLICILRAFALSDLGAGVGYVVKYLTKVHKTVVEEKYDRKSVLTLAMMWIFKKCAYSVSRGFEGLEVRTRNW